MHYTCLVVGNNPDELLEPFDYFGENYKIRGQSGEDEYVNPNGRFDWVNFVSEEANVLWLKDSIRYVFNVKTCVEKSHLFPVPNTQCLSASRVDIDWEKTLDTSDCPISALVINGKFISCDDFSSRKEWTNEVIMLLDKENEEAICTAVDCHC